MIPLKRLEKKNNTSNNAENTRLNVTRGKRRTCSQVHLLLHSSRMREEHQLQDLWPEWVELMPCRDLHFPPSNFWKFTQNWRILSNVSMIVYMTSTRKKEKARTIGANLFVIIVTLHLSMLTNSTCFPPNCVIWVSFGIPTSSRTSANLAPPQMAKKIRKIKNWLWLKTYQIKRLETS